MRAYSQESEVLFATVAWSRHATREKARRVTRPDKGCERDYRKRDTRSSSFLLKIVQTSVTTDHRILVSEFISFKLEGSFFLSIEGVLETLISFTKMKKISYSNFAILTYPSQEKKLFHAWHAFVYIKTGKCLHVIKTCIWTNILNYIKGML